MHWHQLSGNETLQQLNTSGAGLGDHEVRRRRAEYGPNLLAEAPPRTALQLFLSQFADFMIVVLLVAALTAAVIGEWVDAAVIIAIVVLNAALGFFQEYRAATALAALRRLAAPTATVVRGGATLVVAAEELVPGEIVRLEAGMIVPADLRLLEAARLTIEEAALTGESLAVEKQCTPLGRDDLPLGERNNLAFRGTVVSHGRGVGVVVATGMSTELGRIAALLQHGTPPPTPLQKRLARFGRRLSLIILVICAGVFALGLARGEDPLLIFLTAVSLAVAAIPEALPAVVTMALAFGAAKLVKANALVRKLPAVETLGAVTYICSDKTGTLTRNCMTVEEVVTTDDEQRLLAALALCNDASGTGSAEVEGEATETALYRYAAAAGLQRETLERELPRCAELPFDSGRKCMTTFHCCADGTILALTKGAAEIVLARCLGSDSHPFDRSLWEERAETMAAAGLRTLAVAERRWTTLPAPLDSATTEEGLTLLGLIGLLDPPRAEAAAAVASCRAAGIIPVMITGDHLLTACAIARRLDLLRDGDEVITGVELQHLDDAQLAERVTRIRVYARVAPEEKLRIVQALQRNGEFVAMTGDGVNDAPALQCADIGLAMGQGGTDVAREASHLVLLDDNFATIVAAVREGRRIYDNILRFVIYSITSNSGTLVAIAGAPFCGLPLPLLPIQVLWLNLLCDSLPGLALTTERAEPDAMQRPPVDPRAGIFSNGRGWYVFRHGLIIGTVALTLQGVALRCGLPWQTMVFTFLVFNRLVVALTLRSERQSLLCIGPFSNRPLAGAIAIVALLQLAVIYLPPLQPVFRTTALSAAALAISVVAAGSLMVFSESEKWWRRRHPPVSAAKGAI